MKTLLIGILACVATTAHAATYKINLPANSIKVGQQISFSQTQFSQLSAQGFETSKQVGAPELPVKTWLIQGRPEQINVQLHASKIQVLENTRPTPVQPQACRCDNEIKSFQFDSKIYSAKVPAYKLSYLGAFRGTPITQVQVNLGQYDSARNEVQLLSQAEVTMNLPEFSFGPGDYKDYLIIAPESLVAGVAEFATWKRSRGMNVIVEFI